MPADALMKELEKTGVSLIRDLLCLKPKIAEKFKHIVGASKMKLRNLIGLLHKDKDVDPFSLNALNTRLKLDVAQK